MSDNYTHVAFADESHYNLGRFRALGVVTLERKLEHKITEGVRAILHRYGKRELKWSRLSGDSRTLGAAEEVCELVVEDAASKQLRVDILIWDVQDSRHNIQGRDDIGNLHRMYHHLFKNVLVNRWPDEALWRLRLDESTVLDFEQIHYFLELADSDFEIISDAPLIDEPKLNWRSFYRIVETIPCLSHEHPLIQIADILAGLACFSRSDYSVYCEWDHQNPRLTRLPLFDDPGDPVAISRSQKARFQLLRQFNENCKNKSLGVSLKTDKGLRTKDPRRNLNFWWYEPQGSYDKAPTRNG